MKSYGTNSHSHDKVHGTPRVADDHLNKEYEVKECTVENNSFLEEDCYEKQEVLGVKSTNINEANKEKMEDQKFNNDPKKLSMPDTKSGMNGNACENLDIPNPSALATEKHGAESPLNMTSPGANNLQVSIIPEC